jgi:predicted SprT family Zn-dependent metalloprotease
MVYRKKTYKDVTDPKIWAIWEEVQDEAKSLYPRYFEDCEPELYQDNSYSHLGYCWQTFRNAREMNVDKVRATRCIILLSQRLGQDYDEIRSVLCHEFGHFVSPKEDHGYLWKARSDKIGERWNIKASRLSNNETFKESAEQARKERENKSEYKYRAYCPDCGTEWKYKTNCAIIQKPERWRCSVCKAKLKSERI